MKKISTLFIIIAVIGLFSGCPGSSSSANATGEAEVDGWIITTSNFELVDDLSNSISSQEYNGGTIEVEYNEKPGEGMLFGLIKITAEKTSDATGNFSWENTYVEDNDGNKYYRHENDTFLSNYNFQRIKSIDLTLGTSKGFACYEISESSKKSDLFFVYEGTNDTVKIQLN